MNPKLLATLFAAFLAAFSLITPAPQPNSIEAARLNNIGVAYMNQQLFEKGLKQFQLAAEADPKFPIARLNEGVAYLNLQKVDQAKAELEGSLKQDPKNPNAWYSLGLLAKNTGDAQASIEAFKHVTEIDPNDADTWYFLGTAYSQAQAVSAGDRRLPAALEAESAFTPRRSSDCLAPISNPATPTTRPRTPEDDFSTSRRTRSARR